MWVSKQDVGTESYTEAEKGQASDSFKRACFNWGIGRELYTAPFIWCKAEAITASGAELAKKRGKDGKDRWALKGFVPTVSAISYDDKGNISKLTILNKGKVVYTK